MSKKKSSIGKKIGSVVAQQLKKTTQEAARPVYEQQAGQEMTSAIRGAAQNASARNYNNAAAAYQTASAHGGLPTYAQLQDFFGKVSGMAQATQNAAQNGALLPRNVQELERLRRGYSGMLQQSNWAKRLLNLTEDEYNTGYLYPSKYQGANRQTINENMARLKAVGDSGKSELNWLRENQYNYWTPEELSGTIKQYESRVSKNKRALSYLNPSTGDFGIDHDLGSESYARSSRLAKDTAALETELGAMRTAKEINSYRDAMKGWTAADREDLQKLARLTGENQNTRRNAQMAMLLTPGQNDAFLPMQAEKETSANSPEIRRLQQKFRDMGYSEAQIQSLVDYTLRQQHAEERAATMQEMQEFAKAHPFWSSVASVPLNMTGALGYADLALQGITAGTDAITGDRKRIDQNSAMTLGADVSSGIRGAVSEDMEPWQNFLYQTGMSMADFVAAAPFGGGAEVVLGGSAAMQATRDAYARGASDWQALAIGAFAGVAEGTFEHLSLGNLRALQSSAQIARRTAKEILIETAKQAGVEGSEEVFTSLANNLADAWIMGDKSALNTAIRDYMAQGMTEEEATRKAYQDGFISILQDFAGGALSGGVLGGITSGAGNVRINAENRKTGQDIRKAGNMGAMIEQGLAMPEGSAAYTAAQQAQNAKEGSRRQARHVGEAYTAMQRGELRSAMQEQLEAWGAENSAETAEAVMRSIQHQTLTNRQEQLLSTNAAQRILAEYEYAQNNSVDPDHWTRRAQGRQFARTLDAYTPRQTEPEHAQNVPQSIQEYAGQYGDQAKAVQRVYELTPDADLESFAVSFDAAYEAGQQGAELETIQNHNAMAGLEPQQVKLAWQMGKESSASGGRIATAQAPRNDKVDLNENGGNQNGTEVHLRAGGERADGARTLGSVRSLETTAERRQAGKKAADRPADGGALKVTVGAKISALRLGVENGSTAQTAYTVTGNYSKSIKKAIALGKERGLEVIPFAGGNLGIHTRADKNGYVASARGLVQGNRVYVRVDHPQFTADQIMRHELGHEAIRNGEVDIKAVRERIRTEFGEEQFDAIVQLYLSAYAETGMTADEIWEEIVCDSLGDMNIFSGTFEGIQRKTGELLRGTKKTANELRGEKREQEGRAPPEGQRLVSARFSQETKPDKDTKAATRKESVSISATDPANLARYQAEITSVLDGTMSSGGMVLIGRPSAVLSKYLHSEHPLYMPQSAIKKAALTAEEGGKHGLGRAVLDELPFQFEDPLAITGNTSRHVQFNDNSIVVWTDWMTENGDSVIVPIRIDINGKVGLYNNVNTVFDAHNPDYVADLLRDGNVLYTKNNRSIQELLSTRRQVPKVQQMNASDNSISDFTGKSNPKTSRDLESLEELRRENRELRERAKKWRRETTRTKQPEVRADDVRRAAKSLIRDMQSTVKTEEITDELQSLAEYMMRGEGKNERAPSWTEIKERAGAIAETLVDNAEALSENSDPELYREMKQYVRDTKMTIADRDKGDIPNGYEYFRRQNVGILRLGKDGLAVDKAYDQLRDQFGEGFFPSEITHPADQLMRIADVINGLKPVYENPHTAHRAEAVEWTANAIIDTLLSEDVRQTVPTYADRAEAKLDARVAAERDRADARVAAEREKAEARRKAYMERSHAAIERVRAQRDRQIAKVKQEHRDQKARARDRKTRSEMWRGILKLKQDFQRMVDKPEKGNSRHAPMGLAIALRNVADCFDRERSRRDPNVKLPEFKEALVRLRDEYESMKDTEPLSFYYDPVVMEQLAGVNQALRNVTDPTAMTTGQVAQIYDALRMCKHSIATANRFIAMEYDKGITEAGRQWGGEVMRASPLIRGIGGQLLNYQLRPDSFFARISGFAKGSVGEHVQQMFVNGTEKMLRIQQNFYYAFEKFSTDKRFDALTKRGEKALVDVGLKDMDGNTVKLTRDQMLSVFMHLRSEDNLRAAAYGGLDVPNAKAYYTGNIAQSFDNSVRTACIDASTVDLISEQRQLQKLAREDEARGEVRPEVTQRLDEIEAELQAAEGEMISTLLDVRAAIEKQLTDFEKDLVAAADAWMKQSADYINAETLAMYGIEKANVEHYWTIHRNTNFVNTDMRTAADEINLENWGSLKERVRSHAPVKLTGFIFELDNHTKKMSQFCGFAAVQRDFNKLYNTRLPGQHTSLSEQVQKKFGSGEKKLGVSGQEYIDNYIKSISGGEHVKPSPIAWFRMNLPRATLSANFRVALSQVASVPTAAAEVGWGAMAKGFARYSIRGLSAKQQEQLARTDPWFWQRSRGEGGMREFAEMKESTLAIDRAYNKVAGTKVGKALLNWCQRFDMYATYTQWAMAEEWVKSNRKDLEKGSDAWNEAVSHKYRDIIRKTQPNYTTTERSDLLRDSRETMKWATMYKTQSNQNLNILYDATARLRQYTRDHKAGRNGVTDADLKEARQQFARAYTGVILGGTVTFVLFRALANALMHSMNAYRDDDEELTKESVANGLMQETLGAMTGMFLLGSEIEEIVTAAVTGGKYWGLSDSGISALSDVVEDSLNLLKKVRSGDAALQDYRKVINSFMAPLGIPGENIMKIVNGVRYHIEDIQNGEFLSFEAGVSRTAKQQGNRFVHALRDKNTALMQRIYAEMVETSGAQDPEKATRAALRKRIKSMYLGEEDGVTLTDKQAVQLLGTYGGKTGEDAEELIREWSFEKAYGFKYDDLKDRYLSGELREKDFVSARVKYGGKIEEEAQKELLQLKCFQDYGIEYGEKSVVEAVENGDITPEEAKSIWMEYGGLDEKKAQNRADQARFVMENPGTDYDLVKNESVQDYYEFGKPANIPADTFMEYWSNMDDIHADLDANGKTVSNSRRTKIISYIDGLNISDAQKDALFLTQYAQSSLKYCTWRQ